MRIKKSFKTLCASVLLLGGGFLAIPAHAQEKSVTEPIPITTPRLNIPIPTLPKLSEVPPLEDGGQVVIPWVGEYFAAAYQYFVGIAVIVAIIMMMVGGLQWSASAGSGERINSAKSKITNGLLGMFLALGSYLILFTINPDLVKFKALTIGTPERVDLEEYNDSLDQSQVSEYNGNIAESNTFEGQLLIASTGANQFVKAMAAHKPLFPAAECGKPANMIKIIDAALSSPICQGPCNCAPTVIKIMAVSGCPYKPQWGMVPTFFKSIESLRGESGQQLYELRKVSVHGAPSPGDIIFTNSNSHVGIYYGNGKMVDSGTSAANWSHCKKVAPNCPQNPKNSVNNAACQACALIPSTSPIGKNGKISYLRPRRDVNLYIAEKCGEPYIDPKTGSIAVDKKGAPKKKDCSCATNQCFAQRKFDIGVKKAWQFDNYAHYIGGK